MLQCRFQLHGQAIISIEILSTYRFSGVEHLACYRTAGELTAPADTLFLVYVPQKGPSSDWSAQSLLPSQIFSGGKQEEVSLAQGCPGGLQMASLHASSSERSSQSLSPSHTQLLLMHFPVDGDGDVEG